MSATVLVNNGKQMAWPTTIQIPARMLTMMSALRPPRAFAKTAIVPPSKKAGVIGGTIPAIPATPNTSANTMAVMNEMMNPSISEVGA